MKVNVAFTLEHRKLLKSEDGVSPMLVFVSHLLLRVAGAIEPWNSAWGRVCAVCCGYCALPGCQVSKTT